MVLHPTKIYLQKFLVLYKAYKSFKSDLKLFPTKSVNEKTSRNSHLSMNSFSSGWINGVFTKLLFRLTLRIWSKARFILFFSKRIYTVIIFTFLDFYFYTYVFYAIYHWKIEYWIILNNTNTKLQFVSRI